jgi:hypothetical protein
MPTKTPKSTSIKSKSVTTSAPKVARSRKSDTSSDSIILSHAQIAARAYEHFAARGYQHGYDVEDWLTAERELTGAA